MGLDMYLNGRKDDWRHISDRYSGKKTAPVVDGFPVTATILHLGYWRKHPNLHGYIVQNFAEGHDECQEIDLSAENLQQLIRAIEADQLPKTEGFFFGESARPGSEYFEEEKSEALEIFRRAHEWLVAPVNGAEESRSVNYRASW